MQRLDEADGREVQKISYRLSRRQAAIEPERASITDKSQGHLLENTLLFRGGQSFVLFKLSPDWMRPAHIVEGNLV